MPELELAPASTEAQTPRRRAATSSASRASSATCTRCCSPRFSASPPPACPCASAKASGRAACAGAVGGFGAILFFHKLCALVLTIAFLIHVKEIFTRGLFRREKGIFWGATSMVANWKDVKDIFDHMRWFLGLGPKPQFERYAYWEKFDYWAVFWGMIVIGFSGYAMWFAPFFAHFLPGWALNAVLVIHSEEGLLAILFIFSIHFVNTHLRPDSFPMDMVIFTGVESEEEFKHKRPLEYARMVREGKLEQRLGVAPALGSSMARGSSASLPSSSASRCLCSP